MGSRDVTAAAAVLAAASALVACGGRHTPPGDDAGPPDADGADDAGDAFPDADVGSSCGNGVVEAPEGCDDGNRETEPCDYGVVECEVCDASCRLVPGEASYCGDGVVDPGESCDGSPCSSGAPCSADCACGPVGGCPEITAPTLVSRRAFDEWLGALALEGSLLYAAVGEGGLVVMDATDPTLPVVGSVDGAGGSPSAVAVVGRYAYLAGLGLQRVDVGDPREPRASGIMLGTMTYEMVAPAGPYLLLGGRSAMLHVLEPAGAGLPDVLADHPTPVFAAIADGEVVYAVENLGMDRMDASRLLTISLTDPTRPETLGSVVTPGDPRDVALVGGHAFVADMTGVSVFDVSDPTAPEQVAFYPVIAANGVRRHGSRHVLVAAEGLTVLDVDAPAALHAVASVPGPLSLGLVSDDRTAYLNEGDSIAVIQLCE